MTNPQSDEHLDAYLWDPAAPAHEDVLAVEQRLASARYDPDLRPLSHASLTRPHRGFAGTYWWQALAAAVVVLVAGASLLQWRLTWPRDRAWSIESTSNGSPERLGVGETLRTGSEQTATVRVARIGTMRVDRDSAVTLRMTQGNRHGLILDRGTVHVRVWAPPATLSFRTPAGEVLDMGCEFDLTVDALTSRVRVTSGWVQLENDLGESLVPEGASASMTATTRPGVPVFDDAAVPFEEAVRRIEAGRRGPRDLEQVTALARPRDMLTLLILIERGVGGREQLAARAAELVPPPPGVSIEAILKGETRLLWRWHDTLSLPPTKGGWWLNWKDALPSRSSDSRR